MISETSGQYLVPCSGSASHLVLLLENSRPWHPAVANVSFPLWVYQAARSWQGIFNTPPGDWDENPLEMTDAQLDVPGCTAATKAELHSTPPRPPIPPSLGLSSPLTPVLSSVRASLQRSQPWQAAARASPPSRWSTGGRQMVGWK